MQEFFDRGGKFVLDLVPIVRQVATLAWPLRYCQSLSMG